MTTTETDAPPEDEAATPPGGAPPTEPPALEGASRPRNEALWTRAILPIALPVLAALAMAVWVINLSRAFIAGGKDGSLVIVLIITVSIMLGASLVSASQRMRPSSHVMIVSLLLVFVITMGFITFGPSLEHGKGGGGYQEPNGKAGSVVAVGGGPSPKYDKSQYTAKAGVVEVDFKVNGAHNVNIQEVPGFQVNPSTKKLKVNLKPGKYTIYCSIDGHRAAGMQATIVVS